MSLFGNYLNHFLVKYSETWNFGIKHNSHSEKLFIRWKGWAFNGTRGTTASVVTSFIILSSTRENDVAWRWIWDETTWMSFFPNFFLALQIVVEHFNDKHLISESSSARNEYPVHCAIKYGVLSSIFHNPFIFVASNELNELPGCSLHSEKYYRFSFPDLLAYIFTFPPIVID